ncbi:MAG: hypothetical protein AAFP26_11160, partial [Planctomycetota bacterium]
MVTRAEHRSETDAAPAVRGPEVDLDLSVVAPAHNEDELEPDAQGRQRRPDLIGERDDVVF